MLHARAAPLLSSSLPQRRAGVARIGQAWLPGPAYAPVPGGPLAAAGMLRQGRLLRWAYRPGWFIFTTRM
jgi:hypothetical protein